MVRAERVSLRSISVAVSSVSLVLAALAATAVLWLAAGLQPLAAQAPAQHGAGRIDDPASAPTAIALPIAEDRGEAGLEQALKRLGTTASVLMIVAHPDDEDGSLLTYLSRGRGVRCTLFTLTRGEGGQNAMSDDLYDALGLTRTSELLKADEFYGATQLWGTEADFGFSKTQEEAFARWGHDRVLYDAVLAVRRTRPQVIVSTFIGGITDGHGQHQVSGEIAQEAFKAAGDPKVFPEQLRAGLEPWQPLAVYSMVPFAPIENGKMFDYATGKSAPAKFLNYVTGEWSTEIPSDDVTLPSGDLDPVLGRSYMQIAREGWGEQKSQNGGASPTLSGPGSTNYHLWAAAPAAERSGGQAGEGDLFHNGKVQIDTSIAGLGHMANHSAPEWLPSGLRDLDAGVKRFETEHGEQTGLAVARALAPLYREALDLRGRAAESNLDAVAKADLLFELDSKIEQFQDALRLSLGLDLVAFTTHAGGGGGGPFRGQSPDETPRSVTPGEDFRVRVHAAQATGETQLKRVWLESATGDEWKNAIESGTVAGGAPTSDPVFKVHAPADAEPTAPYFYRPTTEQAYYDLSKPQYRGRSYTPYPLTAWAEFSFNGLPIRLGMVVQTMERVLGPGGIYEPLVVTPAIGVRVQPEARILPLDGSALPVKITVHALGAAEGTVELKLPQGWRANPAQASFKVGAAGDAEPIKFSVTPGGAETGAYSIKAIAHSGGHDYASGWQSIGYAGLRPFNLYRAAELKTRKVDVKLAPGLRIGYAMGSGDEVPEVIEGMGVTPHLLSDTELASADLSVWDTIVIGIRAYATRPELGKDQARLDEFVRRGGTLVVEYQTSNFGAPLPLAISQGRRAENVVEESAPVKLLEPGNPLLNWPNKITTADFDGWVEERGHSFLASWDKGYTTLTETADTGQDPQRGGLVVAHPGKGTYIYVAYALYRQFPELVPGAYRLMANLLSAGKHH